MRWLVLTLLFAATTINYLDRGILGVILPEIRKQLTITTEAYGVIVFVFQIAYGIGSLVGGKLLDRYGTRIGYAAAAALWSAAAAFNALAGSALQFGIFRTLLGFGEAPNFPAVNKAGAEWFRPDQRAMAMGVVNFGTNLAQIIGPPVFIAVALTLGWRACFFIMGLLGFVWVPLWLFLYRLPTQSEATAASLPVAGASHRLSIKEVLGYRQAWGYAIAKFLTDPVWWLYLVWLPTYLNDVRHFTPRDRGAALTLVYAISGIGAVAGGAISSFLIARGWSVGWARKATMAVCAILMPLGGLGVLVGDSRIAVLLFGVATAAHQAWMTNLFTTPADVFPAVAVGGTNGFGVSLGALGGALFSGLLPGYLIPQLGYVPVFLSMHLFYLAAWWVVHRLMGNLEPIALEVAA
jgi:ACS family hexuronate transporter-like MFS transporter